MRMHGGGRLKKREEPGMRSDLAASSSPPQESERESGSDGHYNSSDECDSERNSDTPKSYSAALLASSSSSSSSVWHPHHLSDIEMSTSHGATVGAAPWRDVVLHTSMATDGSPPSSMAAVVPSKRKKAKKEVFFCHEPNCGKQFPRSFALRRHMRIHTGTKPYACDHAGCSQRFNTSGNLSRHKRIHSGERPYPCIFATCGKKFNTSTKLKRHMRIHFPEGQNVFRCIGLDCGWSCGNYKEFAAHQKLQHNIIVGAGLEAVSAAAAAAAAVVAAATGHHMHTVDDERHYEDRSPTHYDPCSEQGYDDDASSSSTAYLYNYGKPQHALPLPAPPLPSVSSSQPRKLTGNSTTNNNTQYHYDNGFNSVSGPSREPTKKGQNYETEHSYSDYHHRRGKSTTTVSYALPPSFPSSDTATHYAPRSMALSSIYDSNATLAISSESALFGHQHAQSSSHRAGVLSGHSLRHEEETQTFKHEHESNNNQYEHESRLYDHQPHPHASPAHHHILRPPPPSHHGHHGHHGHHDHHDTMKFPIPPPMNPAAAEFTGEELSVVLELMKDSYY